MRQVTSIAVAALLAVGPGTVAKAQAPRFADLHRMLPFEAPTTATCLLIGDLDGDGDLDIWVGHDGAQSRLYLNEGTGLFLAATSNLPQLTDETYAGALGDVDGDGDLDLLVGDEGQDRLLLNGGNASFSDATGLLPVDSDDTSAVALADVDGDGDLDALVGNYLEPNRLLLNDGAGAFSDASGLLPPAVFRVGGVAVADVDSDGDLDLLWGDGYYTEQSARLQLNDGTGVFTEAAGQFFLPNSSTFTASTAFGDVDADGDFDAVLVTGATNLSYSWMPQDDLLFLNDGAGGFTPGPSPFPAPDSGNTSAVALGDVDGDGDLDALFGVNGLCTKWCGSYLNRLRINDGSGSFADAGNAWPTGLGWTSAVGLADLDGDGDLDAVTANDGPPGGLHLFLNDGTGAFTDVQPGPSANSPAVTAVAVGDLDGDGDLDAFVGRRHVDAGWLPVGSLLLLNDGAGLLVPPALQPPGESTTTDVALGDVDADGDLDALVTAGYSDLAQSRLYLNGGGGGFSDATDELPQASLLATSAALGDVDGDGDLDALIGVRTSLFPSFTPSRLYLNDGGGSFTYALANLPPFLHQTTDVALGDVDVDGDLDAFLGNTGQCPACVGQQNRLYLNDGSGLFSNATSLLPAVVDPTRAVDLGDVDGDGDLDALIGEGTGVAGVPDRLLLNDGSGAFSDASSQLPPNSDITLSAALVDVEGDGDLDALEGTASGNLLYMNDGSGIFSDATSLFAGGGGAAIDLGLGDLDGDGDLDALLADTGQVRVLPNLIRHLAWRALPRVGKPLTFDIHGPTWGAWFLVASAGTGNTPIPPLGVIRLDLATLMPQFGGLLDAQGHVAVTYQVPAMTALVGQSLYWQAVVVGPARLTNLETTTFTNL